jgi:hypothetical protein
LCEFKVSIAIYLLRSDNRVIINADFKSKI